MDSDLLITLIFAAIAVIKARPTVSSGQKSAFEGEIRRLASVQYFLSALQGGYCQPFSLQFLLWQFIRSLTLNVIDKPPFRKFSLFLIT